MIRVRQILFIGFFICAIMVPTSAFASSDSPKPNIFQMVLNQVVSFFVGDQDTATAAYYKKEFEKDFEANKGSFSFLEKLFNKKDCYEYFRNKFPNKDCEESIDIWRRWFCH